MFSILVQGLTIEKMIQEAKKVDPNKEEYLRPAAESLAKKNAHKNDDLNAYLSK